MKCLVVVAHPDDEIIWMGGTILKNKDWNWTIVSLCRKYDKDRAPKFFKVCKNLNAIPIISNLDDEKLEPLPIEEICKKIKKILPEIEYDYIYTHWENGEYGHIRHREIHNAVKRLIEERELKCKKVFYFSYQGDNIPGGSCIANKRANIFIKLPEDVYLRKKYLIKDIYGFDEESFEVKSSGDMEAFMIKEFI